MKTRSLITLVLALFVTSLLATAQEASACPMHAQHAAQDAHHAGVDARGDQAMGFSHDKTAHHFLLKDDGGAIEVTANDSADKQNVDAIRGHLKHIAVMFRSGDFSTPMFIHDRVPPGVPVMKAKKIDYKYEEIAAGGRIVITSADQEAIAAVHDFLQFQIDDHRTGDEKSIR